MADLSRVALFIDGANLYATAKALGFDIDYKRFNKRSSRRHRTPLTRYRPASFRGAWLRNMQAMRGLAKPIFTEAYWLAKTSG